MEQSTRSRSAINIGSYAERDAQKNKNASSSKGKGKAVLKQTHDETRGPHTRNASKRMAASRKIAASDKDKDILMKSLDNELTSEVCVKYVGFGN